jgi:hypothetical protein
MTQQHCVRRPVPCGCRLPAEATDPSSSNNSDACECWHSRRAPNPTKSHVAQGAPCAAQHGRARTQHKAASTRASKRAKQVHRCCESPQSWSNTRNATHTSTVSLLLKAAGWCCSNKSALLVCTLPGCQLIQPCTQRLSEPTKECPLS